MDNREALLRAALLVLAEQPRPSLDAIAEAAGLSRRALYGHFPDRESLLHAVIDVMLRRFEQITEATAVEDPRVALARLASQLCREATALRAAANVSLHEIPPPGAESPLMPLRRRLGELTRAGFASGALRPDMPPETLAFLIEGAARATLREFPFPTGIDSSTVVRAVLGIAGLSWQEQAELLAAHPEILVNEA